MRLCLMVLFLSLAAGLPQIPLLGSKILPRLPRIVGGNITQPGEFPYQVSMQRQGLFGRSHTCGGSILNEHHVLTAAHCLQGSNPANTYVVLGEYDLGKNSGDEQVIISSELIIHEHYDSQTITNDVGIIRLVPSITINELVQPVSLPSFMEHVPVGTTCVITGWGATVEGGGVVDVLRKVMVPVVSDSTCRNSYGVTDIADHMLCAGVPEGGKDSCQGDSGGPLVCGGYQYGITSWGYGCARPDYPGVYTEVSYFINWIEANSS